jgi:hypothetical protein
VHRGFFGRHFDPEIAPRNYDAIRFLDDRIDVPEGLRFLDLGNDGMALITSGKSGDRNN